MNSAAPRPSPAGRTRPRRAHHSGSNQVGSALPAREGSYSIAPPGTLTCWTCAPGGQRKGLRMLNFTKPPQSLCILRLSAIGDTCHVVPIVRALQRAWPATQLTWIIGKAEARLMSLVEGVEFITVDKRAGFLARHALREQLRGRHF